MEKLPTIRQLEAFVALAAARSFRRAAERIGVSQPSLSAQIRSLEETLGVALVERRASGAALTPLGREALVHAQAALEAARAVARFAAGARDRLSGRLRLGVSSTVGPYLMPRVVATLHAADPDLRLFVRESAPETLARELREGLHDGVIAQLPLTGEGLCVEELFRERLLVLVPVDHPLAAGPAAPVEALAGQDLLTLDARFELSRQAADLAATFGARLSADYEGGSLDALRLMVGMGAGIAFAPELYVRSEVRPGGDVAARPLRGRSVQRVIGLAWRRSFADAEAMARIAAAARDAFAALTAPPLDI